MTKTLKREDLTKLNELFKTPIKELESLWLANKVYSIVRDEESALSALKVAEEQVKYKNLKMLNSVCEPYKELEEIVQTFEEQLELFFQRNSRQNLTILKKMKI